MGRTKQPERMTADEKWLDMPLFKIAGFDYLKKTIGLAAHTHKFFEITYVSEGEATWVVGNGTELKLHGGWAAVTQPGILHQGKFKAISPCRLFWAGLDPFAENAFRDTLFSSGEIAFIGKTLKSAGNTSWKADAELANSFEALRLILENRKMENPLARASGRIAVCRLIAALVKSLLAGTSESTKSEFTKKTEEYIQKNTTMEISISELASFTGVSKARFSERFKAETGYSPADYIRRLCCEKACRLIEEKKLSMTEIAYRLKFSSSQHFSEIFKKYTGRTPSQYKKGI